MLQTDETNFVVSIQVWFAVFPDIHAKINIHKGGHAKVETTEIPTSL